MSELDQIKKSHRGPITLSRLKADLAHLGLKSGMTAIVHSSLSSLGWVCGGIQSIIMAFQESVTKTGTLIMPTYTSWNSDPSEWIHPPIPQEWFDQVRAETPAYQPDLSPCGRNMSRIVECFRGLSDVRRSSHPRASFAAWGKNAEFVTGNHSLDFPFGEESPLARAYDLGSYILLIGVSYDTVSSWYLSAFRSNKKQPIQECYAAIIENGSRVWKKYKDCLRTHNDFEQIGSEFEKKHRVHIGQVGYAQCKLFSCVEAIDFATNWMNKNR